MKLKTHSGLGDKLIEITYAEYFDLIKSKRDFVVAELNKRISCGLEDIPTEDLNKIIGHSELGFLIIGLSEINKIGLKNGSFCASDIVQELTNNETLMMTFFAKKY